MTERALQGHSRAGHGFFSVGYQFISVNGFQNSVGISPIGDVETQSLNLELEYYLTDRWTLVGGIPYVKKRYLGQGRHDPLLLDPPRPEVENVDLGHWNSGFQDFHLGVRYLAIDSPLHIEPFVFYGLPSQDYPHFGHAAIGQNRWKLHVGSAFEYFPPLSDAFFRFDIAYVFVEETLGVSINHWNLYGEAGYFFMPQLTGRIFAMIKEGDGLIFPDDFPPPRTTEKWYQHDRLVKHNYANMGVGLDWSLNDKYQLSTSWMTMIWAEQVHIMEYAVSVSLSRSF